MMLKINHTDIKKDILTTSSNVREVLRALYLYGPDYIIMVMGGRERLVHKEQLVSLLELGKASSTIEDIMAASLNEPMSARMQLEDIPQDTFLLLFAQRGSGKAGDLSHITFREYRERAVKESAVPLPDWWDVPLPLLFMDEEHVTLNKQGVLLMPCDAAALAKQAERMAHDRIITVREKKRERTFSLRQLVEKIFLIEDISGDFEMAEDLVWWAAVGKAFYRRLEENGAVIRRLSPLEKLPEDSPDVIPCSWEGELIGSVVIGARGDAALDEPQESAMDGTGEESVPEIESPVAGDTSSSSPEPAPDEAVMAPKEDHPEKRPVRRKTGRKTTAGTGIKPKPAPEKKKRANVQAKAEKDPHEKKAGPKSNSETRKKRPPKTEGTPDIATEESTITGNLVRLNKNAARKAYGGTTVRRVETEDGHKIKG